MVRFGMSGSGDGDSSVFGEFPRTRWSVVLSAQNEDPDALSSICQDYWFPIYSFARRGGASPADAEDLTQGFFSTLVHSDFMQRADQQRGKLRSFLLASFQNFKRMEWRRSQAQKRGGGAEVIRFDANLAEERLEPYLGESLSPEIEFDRGWAREILAKARLRLQQDYLAKGKSETFRILHTMLEGDGSSASYRELGAALGCEESTARFHAFKLRERFREEVRLVIRETVTTEEELAEELAYLQQVFQAQS